MTITRTRTRIGFALAVSGAALLAAGCGDSTSSHSAQPSSHSVASTASASAATRTDFDDADVSFLQSMYPHHAQAVAMAQLVPSRSRNPEVQALATAIHDAQAPEMERMSALLRGFGKPAPTTADHAMPDMTAMPDMPGMSTPSVPGMMSGTDMSRLESLSGPDFDRAWLLSMIDHHTGAITMANDELAHGVNGDAEALARSIVAAQQGEIDRMHTMLGN
ncbi:DUF305 domain-containing protein [Nocardia sp. alder85J]|uniref:DUF305 domain-containing protein n=1 Tax=Nocardia sp. alder85J TaxID=2862949 RepID=UPI001CD462FC|nr:DUF305 domain-containing protein [Nocardia sp. alder85J]MCX4093228.1 DUF305 domain-containing protein [Nocardia sp. alder85J]